MYGRGGNGVKGRMKGIVNLSSCESGFIRVHANLVQHPSNNISICNLKSLFHNIFRDKVWFFFKAKLFYD